MSNQILISSGAKLRDLDDVIIGTDGVLSSLAFNVANGVPKLDENGKILVSQLPNSVMEFKGVWNAATNTPTLANGTGNAGDVYLCNVAGTVNFGAGPIAFAVGDYAVYTGTVWARSSGATGTVTSVGLSRSGDALSVTGSPITTSGTINIGFAGTNLQYINGAGNLVTFPTIALEAQRLITEVYNETGATLAKGSIVYINGGHGNLPTVTKAIATGDATSAQTYGIVQNDIGNNNNGFVVVIGSLTDLDTQAYTEGTQLYLSGTTAGAWTSTKPYAPVHLVYVAIVTRSHPTQGVVEVSIQNGYEMDELHNVSAQNPDNNDILQYKTATSLWTKVAGTTSNIAEGSNLYFTNARARTAISLTTTGSTGAATYDNGTGVLNIPNYVDQYVGTVTSVGLSAPTGFSVTGSPVTSSGTLALAFASGYSLPTNVKQSNWDDAYTWVAAFPTQTGNTGKFLTTDGSTLSWATVIAGVQSVTASSPLFSSGGANPNITIQVANTSQNGYLSSTDWNTFNGKQNALTNPVTGTGNNNYIAKFSSTGSTIANSLLQSTASNVFINQEDTSLGVDAQANIRLGFVKKSGLTPFIGYASSPFIISSTVGTSIDATNTFVTRFTMAIDGAATFTNTIATAGDITITKSSAASFIANNTSINGKSYRLVSADDGTFRIQNTGIADLITVTTASNVGIGVVPNAWSSPFIPVQIGTYGQYIAGQTNGPDIKIGSNHYYNAGNYIYTTANGAVQLNVGGNSGFQFNVADVGVAGAAVAFTQAMSINKNGNVVIGSITDNGSRLQVTGTGQFTSWVLANDSVRQIYLNPAADFGQGNLPTIQVTSNHALQFATNNFLRMTISSGGNVLIGTATALQSNEKVGIETDTNTALITKFTGGAATGWAAKFWNNATTGNNLIIEFLTESAITSRGSIRYDRGGDRLNILGGGSGLLFTGVSTFSSSVTATGLKSQFIASGISSGAGISFNTDLSGTDRRNWFVGTEENVAGDFVIKSSTAAGGSGLSGNLRFAILNNGNIYIGTSTGVSGGGALQVNGNVNINGLFQINGVTIGGGGGSGVTGSGTTNYIPKWTGSTSLGNSVIQDTGTNVGIGAAPLSFTRLYVTDTGANITGGNAIAGTSIKGVMIENSNNEDQSIGLWFRTGNNHLSGISGQRNNSSSGWGTDLRFYTHENATVDLTYTRERMRITTEGNILIGTTSDNGYKLNLNGSISFAFGFLNIFRGSSVDILVGNSGSVFYIGGNTQVVGSVSASGGFFDTSDARLKTLVEDNYLLSSIANVKAKLYKKDGRMEIGYYAQDLKEILPSAVKEGSDGFLSLSYAQVHTAKIAVIEDEITVLKNKVSELEKQLNLN